MVAMTVWPTDAADGSVANEARWRKMARWWLPSGVIKTIGGEMAPTLAYPNLTVKSGAAWADGHYTELAGDQVLAVTANGLVVVRFDPAANTAELLYRDAVTVPNQVVGGVWEVPIAQVIGSALTDRRGTPITWNPGAAYRGESVYTYATFESGDLGMSPGDSLRTVTVPCVTGRVYELIGQAGLVSRAAAGTSTGAGCYLEITSTPTATIAVKEVFIHLPSVGANAELRGLWVADRTGPVTFRWRIERAWWANAGVRYASGTGTPIGLRVIDLGLPVT